MLRPQSSTYNYWPASCVTLRDIETHEVTTE